MANLGLGLLHVDQLALKDQWLNFEKAGKGKNAAFEAENGLDYEIQNCRTEKVTVIKCQYLIRIV